MSNKLKRKKQQRGITLVALVVTIVVLIILATISINVVLGENGIIRKAEQAKKLYSNTVIEEQESMDTLVEEYENILAGPPPYKEAILPEGPSVAEGMTRVKYNSTSGKWEKVTNDTTEWYNYANKEWANVVLGNATFNSDGTLDESQPYIQLVWIPRFAYKITSQYHTSGETAGNINVVFIGTDNKGEDGTTYSTTYQNATTGGGMSDYVVHPAFEYGSTHLAGFWIGKFESSHTGCTTDVTTGEASYTGNEVMTVKANVTSWRNIKTGDAFATCLAMNKSGNPYGLNTSDNVVDPHLTKNDEWGAVAYLSKSSYGKETEEVFVNNNSNYITGQAGISASESASTSTDVYNTGNGPKASTTGNVYGVYDMSGGAWEYTAAYVANGNDSLTTSGGSLTAEKTESKYRNVYASTVSDGSSGYEEDYELAKPTSTRGNYGDAMYETSAGASGSDGWYSDLSYFPYSSETFFIRGGSYGYRSGTGTFSFILDNGSGYSRIGFRVVIPVLN